MKHIATLNVLGYQEDGEWVALALEMDLRGYGATFEESVEDLRDLVGMQISFARFKGEPGLIWKPAEPVWFELFAQVRQDYLVAAVADSDERESEYSIAGIPIPPAHVIAGMDNFVRSETSC